MRSILGTNSLSIYMYIMVINFQFEEEKGLHVVCLNLRSLFAPGKFDTLRQQVENSNAHIVCLSKTWLKKVKTSQQALFTYQVTPYIGTIENGLITGSH